MLPSPANWRSSALDAGKPHYIAIADAIAGDIRTGVLAPADRLPPQRILAKRLGLNFTTVARGYTEALRRGLADICAGTQRPRVDLRPIG